MRIQDPNLFDPGSGREKFGPGINIPDPQHCEYTVKSPNVVWGLYVVIGNTKISFGPAQFICKAR
jgi:hypothetical protein